MARYLGIDPGPSTGIAVYSTTPGDDRWSVFQCNGQAAFWFISALITAYKPCIIAIEEFEVRNNGGTQGKDAELTRQIANHVQGLSGSHGIRTVTRKPGMVKPWATDKRLTKTMFPLGAKFKDARDAGRHALYAAVRDGVESDPLA